MHSQMIDIETLFEGIYNKLISPEFGKNLGGELPLFIQPVPSERQSDVESQIKRLSTRLQRRESCLCPLIFMTFAWTSFVRQMY